MKITSWFCCYFLNYHRWTVSKGAGLKIKTCSHCGKKVFRYDSIKEYK